MQGMPRLLSHDMWRRRERITRSRRLYGISLLGATARNERPAVRVVLIINIP